MYESNSSQEKRISHLHVTLYARASRASTPLWPRHSAKSTSPPPLSSGDAEEEDTNSGAAFLRKA